MIDRIRGCILGAAAGDAMGAPCEGKSAAQIEELFGGQPDRFIDPPRDVPARGRKAGQVTDAFSIPYMLTEEIIASGRITIDTAKEALIRWGDSEYFEPFAGMTTRKAVIRLNESKTLNTWDRIGHLGNKLFKGHYYALSSNGAAAKAWPAALFSGGDEDKAVAYAARIACSSHDDINSISGACAAAAAVCRALTITGDENGAFEIVQAALRGADKGMALAWYIPDVSVYPGPSVCKRIEMAAEIALHASGKDPVSELRDCIGCGPALAETLPAALGIIAAYRADPMKCISAAAGIGDETATIASIAGAICGARWGSGAFPEEYIEFLDERNGIDIGATAEAVYRICQDF